MAKVVDLDNLSLVNKVFKKHKLRNALGIKWHPLLGWDRSHEGYTQDEIADKVKAVFPNTLQETPEGILRCVQNMAFRAEGKFDAKLFLYGKNDAGEQLYGLIKCDPVFDLINQYAKK